MESHLHEWVNLLLRWIHFIVGVAWIGASFYFNWLENNLDRKPPQDKGIAGNLWAVHGGGFYHLKKFQVGPGKLPARLHWFKWEAYTTWLSGVALLAVVYYFNARVFLLAPESDLSAPKGVVVGVLAVIGSWFVYDCLCRSPLRRAPPLLAACVFAYLVALAWALSEVFSGRAAYMHVGAAIGTIMVANVFFVIIPAQKEMVAALAERRAVDPRRGANGLLRSRHNNYLTLPVLFIMISVHFPSTYGQAWNWAMLAVLSAAGWMARHYFNVRRRDSRAALALLPLAFALLAALAWLSAPPRNPAASAAVTTAQITPLIQSRCATCHAARPTQPGFAAPPAGLELESAREIELNAARIFAAAVVTKTMPIANLTGMSEIERELLAAWFRHLQKTQSAQ